MAKNRRDLVANSNPFGGPGGSPSLQDLTNSMMTQSDTDIVSDIYRDDEGNLIAYNFCLTPLGIDPGSFDQSKDEWMKLAEWLFQMEGRLSLFIGDMLVGMEMKHGVTYEKVAEHFGLSKKTLYNWKYVCERVDISLRRENLTYSHYMLVTAMEQEEQEKYLALASEENLSKAQLKKAIDDDHKTKSQTIKSSKLERNLETIVTDISESGWKKLSKGRRKKYYQSLQDLLDKLEKWGLD